MTGSALGGLQVLDLSQDVSGAYCGKLLACYGAEVWNIGRAEEPTTPYRD